MNRQRFGNALRQVPFLSIALIFFGCSLGGEAALQSVSGLAGAIGTGFNGLASANESRRMDSAQMQLTLANAALVRDQVEDRRLSRDKIKSERCIVVKILRTDAGEQHDPFLNDVALWVSAGGDPDYAFRYLMDREQARSSKAHSFGPTVPALKIAGQVSLIGNPVQVNKAQNQGLMLPHRSRS